MGRTCLLVVSATATLGVYGLYKIAGIVYREWSSPLRVLPGTKNPSFIYGDLKELWEEEDKGTSGILVEKYGTTFRYKSLFGISRLYTTDTKALNHILMNSYDYEKLPESRVALTNILGAGLLVVEGDKHKQQRRIMNPAFGPAQIRELTDIFVRKSIQLRDLWAEECTKQGGQGRIEILSWLSWTTLDVIGLAGFNYEFNALMRDSKANELSEAFNIIFQAGTSVNVMLILRAFIPALSWILPEAGDAEAKKASLTMSRIGEELLSNSKAAVSQNESLEKDTWKTRDLLSLLVRANVATDLTESQQMLDEDVLAQIPTFIVAGHETTSNATTWALFALSSQNPDAQTKLRNELLTVSTDNPTMDELNALPYLDAVVRETLRLHAPVSMTSRIAMKDDVLPLAVPFTDSKGVIHHEIRIRKGEPLLIPILALNRDKSIWGEDAHEFRPERWESTPDAASSIPGVWGHMLTFLGGPHSCIGYRFALVEMKALLFTLIRSFEFELAVPASDIGKKAGIVHRPILLSNPEGGSQMPLLVKAYQPPLEEP
ncbi:hypothetical protein K443DRAFT_676319 [Laccaria amethystina LaAM-08-1]|uniref:Cytochrome P450 n=1 Tax=Laccaria amethystina LaAM-08-1 TaxID=1095629 RepID=A0A0C9Y7M3_9AGAR|nr:hypothetical protein K443DRAFT_676319 [Laccaria amethystina LaAM-08-1]